MDGLADYRETLVQALVQRADPTAALGMKRYFPGPFNAFGITNGDVRVVADSFVKEHDLTPDQRLALTELILERAEHHEEVMLAFALVHKLVKGNFDDALLERFEYWLANYASNWAHCDDLCMKVIYSFFLSRTHLITSVEHWTKASNPWVRRGANVAILKFINRKIGKTYYCLPLPLVFKNSLTLLDDPHVYVQKSVGWLLKAAADHHHDQVVDFLQTHKARMQRGTLRYAIEKMEPNVRKAILS